MIPVLALGQCRHDFRVGFGSWPLLLAVVIAAQVSEITWLLQCSWLLPALGATATEAALGWQLRPEVEVCVAGYHRGRLGRAAGDS